MSFMKWWWRYKKNGGFVSCNGRMSQDFLQVLSVFFDRNMLTSRAAGETGVVCTKEDELGESEYCCDGFRVPIWGEEILVSAYKAINVSAGITYPRPPGYPLWRANRPSNRNLAYQIVDLST
jgi:hypothetical protein